MTTFPLRHILSEEGLRSDSLPVILVLVSVMSTDALCILHALAGQAVSGARPTSRSLSAHIRAATARSVASALGSARLRLTK
jgi:hypothetical protein